MEGDSSFSLVRRTPGGVERTRPSVKRIVDGMVGDALELARRDTVLAAERRFRIGDLELCEPDYRQLQAWVSALGCSEETLVHQLTCELDYSWGVDWSSFANGKLARLVWDFTRLPLDELSWQPGLEIHSVHFHNLFGASGAARAFDSLHLHALLSFKELRLSLSGDNQAAKLALPPLPNLATLSCSSCNITQLDLAGVPALTGLDCSWNQIAELDLSHVQKLDWLDCQANELTRLDLCSVPSLARLYCWGNPIPELDIRPLRCLETLCYDEGHTTLIQRADQHF